MHGSVLEYIRCGMASLQQSAAVLVSGSVLMAGVSMLVPSVGSCGKC